MAGKDIAAAGAAFSGDGTADGSITVASTTPYRVKARAWVVDNNSPKVEVVITEIVSATVMRVRLAVPVSHAVLGQGNAMVLNPVNYGNSDMSAYTVAQSARIDMPAQFIYNEPLP